MSRKARPSTPKSTNVDEHIPSLAKVCKVKECGRPEYARGYCQTHHRQVLNTGKVSAIRPYRARDAGTEKFAGLRLNKRTIEAVRAIAKEKGISDSAAIAFVLEEWSANGHPWPLSKSRG